MSKDLTRWSRAGLGRFRYVDGNAVTYLEKLREALQARFPAWTDVNVTPASGQSPEERWLAQYQGKRRDFAWEIARALARSAHVLTEHLDAYANEGYLRTTTQWDQVRRLVEMLDYHPAPPASASTYLVLRAKPGKRGTVAAGFQVKNAPEDGSAPLVFESLDDVVIDQELDGLCCKDWNRSQAPFAWVQESSSSSSYQGTIPVSEVPGGVSSGSRGVLVIDSDGEVAGVPVEVSEVTSSGVVVTGPGLPAGSAPTLGNIRVLLEPRIIQKPRLYGSKAVEFEQVHSLLAGDAVAWWHQGKEWKASKVEDSDARRAILSGARPPEGAEVYPLLAVEGHQVDGNKKLVVPLEKDRRANTVWKQDLKAVPVSDVTTRRVPINEDGDEVDAYDEITDDLSRQAYYLPVETPPAGRVVATRSLDEIVMDGDPGKVASGQWSIVAHEDQAKARRISSLETRDDSYVLQLDGDDDAPAGTVAMVYADFAVTLRPEGHDRNLAPVHDAGTSAVTGSVIPLASLPAGLERGRRLIVQGPSKAAVVTVAAVDAKTASIVVTPPLPGDASDFPRHGTVIHGNVVRCGHGETRPARILGSGDATRSNQSFLVRVESLAFVADAAQATGVRAAIEVSVDGRVWQQVATLNDSGPTDHHYTVRMTQEGHVEIGFGDGERGRRLPTGSNNVRAVYRVGSGSRGNLAAHSLSKPVKPHPLVDAVLQPLAASGGGDMEGVESLRDNAPASVLTLDRAVSLRDFAHLAGRHSSVWQARAFALPTGLGRHESVEVVVVPAGGGDLTSSLQSDLQRYLEAAAIPGVQVQVTRFEPVALDLDIKVQVVTSAFDAEAVVEDVRAALSQAFALRRAELGRPLHRAAIYQVVEAVQGVENSTCIIEDSTVLDAIEPGRVARGASRDIRAIFATERQLIYIDPETSNIKISHEEFTL